MQKLLLKISLFLATLLVAGNLIFYQFHLPRFWGVCYDRLHFYQTHASQYNTLFIGSSLTRYQINPVLFDSINSTNSVITQSYNFGVDGACPTELFSTFKYLMNNKPAALKYVFVELTLIDNFDISQMHTLRRKSSFDINQYSHALPLTLESNYDWSSKKDILLFDLCNLTEGSFKINMLKDAYDFKKKQASIDTLSSVTDFIALSVNDSTQGIDTKGKYGNRHQRFLKESLPQLKANTQTASAMFTDKTFLTSAKTDAAYTYMVRKMLSIAGQKGIKLIFILPPRLSKENYQDLLPVYYSIPDTNRIQLADANKYPEFYEVAYSYDIKHINQYAVPYFTSALANNFRKIVARK